MALSNDEIFQIFSWLPAKSILKFQSSCKSFSEFPKENYFQLKQAHNSMLKDDPCFIIQKNPFQKYSERIEIYSLPREDNCCGVPKDFLQSLEGSARILASSNGLLLCRSVRKNPADLFLCNPVTRSYFPIPSPQYLKNMSFEAVIDVFFECNGGNDFDDYKIVLFENPEEWSSNFNCEIFLPKEKTWKEGETFFLGSRSMRTDKPVYLNGFCHFVSDCYPYIAKSSPYYRPYIMAYSVSDGSSKMLRVPKEARRGSHDKTCNMSIFKWGKVGSSNQLLCLVRLRKSVFTAWVLEDYEAGSWVKVLKIRVKAMGVKEKDLSVTDFVVMNGDSLVFSTERKIYRYGMKGEKYGRIEEICEHDCEGSNVLISYSNTLRPCGNGAAYLPFYTTCPSIEAVEGDCAETLPNMEATEDAAANLDRLENVPLISLKEPTYNSVEVFVALLFFFVLDMLTSMLYIYTT